MSVSHPPEFDPLRFVAAPELPMSRESAIAEIAYFLALNRGFEPGHEVEDWLAAEAEFERRQRAPKRKRARQGV